jgi:L-alanine-DL-glutamate epimerase-like enolase superfamily enzyme
MVDPLTVVRAEIWPVDVPTSDRFVIAQGRLTAAENRFVRIVLRGGARGFGEIAPFPDLTGQISARTTVSGSTIATPSRRTVPCFRPPPQALSDAAGAATPTCTALASAPRGVRAARGATPPAGR